MAPSITVPVQRSAQHWWCWEREAVQMWGFCVTLVATASWKQTLGKSSNSLRSASSVRKNQGNEQISLWLVFGNDMMMSRHIAPLSECSETICLGVTHRQLLAPLLQICNFPKQFLGAQAVRATLMAALEWCWGDQHMGAPVRKVWKEQYWCSAMLPLQCHLQARCPWSLGFVALENLPPMTALKHRTCSWTASWQYYMDCQVDCDY